MAKELHQSDFFPSQNDLPLRQNAFGLRWVGHVSISTPQTPQLSCRMSSDGSGSPLLDVAKEGMYQLARTTGGAY